MLEGGNQYGYHRDDCQHGSGDAAESGSQLAEDAGPGFYGDTEFLHSGRQLHKALHRGADFGNQSPDYNEERTQRGHDQADGQDRFPLAFAHVVQLVHEHLDPADDGADGGHQHLAEGNGKLLDLRLEDRQLTAEVILHDSGHLFRHAVVFLDPVDPFLKRLGHGDDRPVHSLDKSIRAAVNSGGQFLNISLAGVHQGEEAGHGVLADQRLGRGGLLRLGKLRKGPSAIRQNI